MSKRHALLTLFVWNPLMVLAGGAIVERFAAQIARLGFAGFVGAFYVYTILFFAPGLWSAFGKKGA